MIFLRKLVEGGSEHSFGIHVAQMAGMPPQIVDRATEILGHLEQDHIRENHNERLKELPKHKHQLSIFEFAPDKRFERVQELLEKVDINTLTPIEALLKLNEVKRVVES